MIASPCNKVCVMNDATGLCRGCYRTLDEIARWSEMTGAERSRVIDDLTRRRSGVAADAGALAQRSGTDQG